MRTCIFWDENMSFLTNDNDNDSFVSIDQSQAKKVLNPDVNDAE